MKYKSFSDKVWSSFHDTLDSVTKQKLPLLAAFDADGTLWDTDFGENFFQWQIRNKVIKGLPENAWDIYHQLKASNQQPKAYLWLAQISKGYSIAQVREWAKQAMQDFGPPKIFEEQKKVISFLQSKNIPVYVVTASVKWAVEPGAELLEIPFENVLGISTTIDQHGLVTDQQCGPISWKEGKVQALKEATNIQPFFCSGNTTGDTALLQYSTHFKLAVSAAPEGSELYKTELALKEFCEQQGQAMGYYTHRF